MGIDVYMRWKGQTKEEKKAQYTGFSTVHGHVGYLREAYHGEPYATKALVPEAWFEETDEVVLPSHILRERLPIVEKIAKERNKKLYGGTTEDNERMAKSYRDFVELAEQKEKETGSPVTIIVSA